MDLVVFLEYNEKFIIKNTLLWCEENNIAVLKYQPIHSSNEFSRAIIFGFKFYFATKEDATAFKLRWA